MATSSASSFSAVTPEEQTPPSGLNATVSTTGGIPQNPYTVGSVPSSVPLPKNTKMTPGLTHTITKPRSQPQTGPELWIVSVLSIGALLLLTKSWFRLATTERPNY